MNLIDRRKEQIKQLPFYQSTATDEFKAVTKQLVREQLAQAKDYNVVRCPDCNRMIGIAAAFRCAYCGVFFCHVCAQLHFNMQVEREIEGVE